MRTEKIVYISQYEVSRDNFMFKSGESKCVTIRHQLKPAIRTKRRGLLSSGLCLQHDNAQHHIECHTVKQIQDLNLPYLLDLAPCDFHFFAP
jgi:hypothetical protein